LSKRLSTILKIGLSLAFGIFLIWYIYRGFSEEDIDNIVASFKNTQYGWILFSLLFAVLSHISRSYRWKYTLKPLGLKPKFSNMYHAVMIGYLLNLAVPRLGEVSRCAALAKTENMPFGKLFGTVIAERIADLVLLLTIATAVVILQLDLFAGYLVEAPQLLIDKIANSQTLLFAGVGGIVFLVALVLFIQKANVSIALKLKGIVTMVATKVKEFLLGILAGLKSILTMEDKWPFIFHTIFIWAMYVMMFYVCFFSLPETRTVPFLGILAAFVLGGIAIIVVQGGLGAYPLAIQVVLGLYGVDENVGYAFGWVVWTAQTALLLIMGFISLQLIPTGPLLTEDTDVAEAGSE